MSLDCRYPVTGIYRVLNGLLQKSPRLEFGSGENRIVKGKAIPRDKATAAAHKLLGQLGVVLWRSELQEAIQERQHEKKGSIAYRGIRRTNTERYLFRLH